MRPSTAASSGELTRLPVLVFLSSRELSGPRLRVSIGSCQSYTLPPLPDHHLNPAYHRGVNCTASAMNSLSGPVFPVRAAVALQFLKATKGGAGAEMRRRRNRWWRWGSWEEKTTFEAAAYLLPDFDGVWQREVLRRGVLMKGTGRK